jgi:2-C-methyl-D-erythritol 4-phosphate cytidylyltransferase
MRVIAIVAGAGRGERFRYHTSKLWAPVKGKPVIYYTFEALERASCLDDVILMCPAGDEELFRRHIQTWGFKKVRGVYAGGEKRQDTVRIGLGHVPESCEIVVIHDAARPFASPALFAEVVESARKFGASTAGIEAVDTVAMVSGAGKLNYLNRGELVLIQTPQAFRREIILKAHEKAREDGYYGTDDAMLVIRAGYQVKVVKGEQRNFKITYPEDIARAEIAL